ncbi:MAG: hypothetical protein R3F56_08700 [Planctomycetota bacterium]
MGALDQDDVRFYDSEERCVAERPSRQIGAVPRRIAVRLARIVRRADEWVFGDEIDADLRGMRRHVKTERTEAAWWRLEVELDCGVPAVKRAVEPGHHVVIAEYPWSSAWCAVARLRTASNDGKQAAIEAWNAATPADLVRSAETARKEPFVSDSRYLVAAVSEPGIVADAETTRARRRAEQYVLGLCADADAVRDALMQDEKLNDLVRLAASGRMRDRRVKDADARMVPYWASDEAAIASVKDLAIQQALAGPVSAKDTTYFYHRPVRDLAAKIFEDHLSRLRKVALRARAPEPRRLRRGAGPEAGSEVAPVLLDVDAVIQAVAQRLAENEESRLEAARLLVQQNLHLVLGD